MSTYPNLPLHVIFGTGPLGLSVMRELNARGNVRIRMVNRSGKAHVPTAVEVVKGDATDSSQTRVICRDAAVVYQCVNAPYPEWVAKFPALQAGIVDGAAASGAKLIVGENVYMYGDTNGKPITENLPYAAHTKKGMLRARLSEDLMNAHREGKVRVAVGRASDYYGPFVTESALGERAFYPMLEGKSAQVAGNMDAPHSYTYIDDMGRTLVILGERDEALGSVWLAPNAPAISTRQMLTIAHQQVGLPPKMSSLGKPMMRFAGIFMPGAREMVEMMYEFEKPFVVDGSRVTNTFGLQATPIEEGLRATLAWYKANPRQKAA